MHLLAHVIHELHKASVLENVLYGLIALGLGIGMSVVWRGPAAPRD